MVKESKVLAGMGSRLGDFVVDQLGLRDAPARAREGRGSTIPLYALRAAAFRLLSFGPSIEETKININCARYVAGTASL